MMLQLGICRLLPLTLVTGFMFAHKAPIRRRLGHFIHNFGTVPPESSLRSFLDETGNPGDQAIVASIQSYIPLTFTRVINGQWKPKILEELLFQYAQHFVRVKAAVATHQPGLYATERFIEGLAHELGAVGTRRRVAWTQSGVGHHAYLTDEGDDRMVRVSPLAVGVVAFGRALLAAIARDGGGAERRDTACRGQSQWM